MKLTGQKAGYFPVRTWCLRPPGESSISIMFHPCQLPCRHRHSQGMDNNMSSMLVIAMG
ncbi:MAG: hypothetical protein Q8P24_13810 [Desulfobacterales bacterium]|nr:hypothetical protein [Desulfobacterales bacterium]